MAETSKHPNNASQQELDRTLDAALAKYTAVEPREGIEQRILARLRSDPQTAAGAWWRWGVAGTLAAIIAVAATLATRSDRTTKAVVLSHPSVTSTGQLTATEKPAKQATKRAGIHSARVRIARWRPQLEETDAANPKLDQFPSPHPLTEQEKLALDYVREFPDEATLIARAQTNLERQEEMERIRSEPAAAPAGGENQE